MTTTENQTNIALYQRFLKALNDANYDELAEVIDSLFADHHPGFEIDGIKSYLDAVRDAHTTLKINCEPEEVIAVNDKVITRVRLTGEHVGTVLGVPATGRRVSWTTTEIWRIANGRLVERWAQDDLLGLREQLSVDADNIALVRRISEVVNARRLEEMDELFADSFVDRNPAWTVTDLGQLKGIIKAAHEALDFTAHLDDIYAADGGKVVLMITFTGRHVGRFFGKEPTGKEVTWTSIEVYRVEGGKVVERWVQADTAGLMSQLGVELPE